MEWLQGRLKKLAAPPAAVDVQATLIQLTAQSIARAIRGFLPQTQEAYVCGGGAHNRELLVALARAFENGGDPDAALAHAMARMVRPLPAPRGPA